MSRSLGIISPKDQPEFKADVVVANILAGPLRELAPVIIEYVAQDGLLALSGVLEEQAEQLQEIYGQFCQMDPVAVKDEWVRLSGIRN